MLTALLDTSSKTSLQRHTDGEHDALIVREPGLSLWQSPRGFKLVIVGMGLLFLLAFVSRDVFVSVESGYAGVLWKKFGGGTVLDRTYAEGVHMINPWNKMYFYNTQMQEIKSTVEMLSADGIDVHLAMSMRFYPRVEQLPLLHQRIGQDYIEKIVRPEVIASVQHVIGKYTADVLYAKDASEFLEEIEREVRSRIDLTFITVHSTMIREFKIQNKYKWRLANE